MNYTSNSAHLLIGEKLKLKRRELKITQKELAALVGVTFQQLQKYESGRSKISIEMLMNICRALNIEVDYFLPKLNTQSERVSLNDSRDQSSTYDDLLMEETLINLFRSVEDQKLKLLITKVVEAMTEAQ